MSENLSWQNFIYKTKHATIKKILKQNNIKASNNFMKNASICYKILKDRPTDYSDEVKNNVKELFEVRNMDVNKLHLFTPEWEKHSNDYWEKFGKMFKKTVSDMPKSTKILMKFRTENNENFIYRNITNNNIDSFVELFKNKGKINTDDFNIGGSDVDLLNNVETITDLQIINLDNEKNKIKDSGALFPYVLLDNNIDLSKYQIYNELQVNEINNYEPCFIHCLRLNNFDDILIQNIYLDLNELIYIKPKAIEIIANKYKFNIRIDKYKLYEDGKFKIYKKLDINNYSNEQIKILLIHQHYIVNEKILYNNKLINIHLLIHNLFKQNKFRAINNDELTCFYKKVEVNKNTKDYTNIIEQNYSKYRAFNNNVAPMFFNGINNLYVISGSLLNFVNKCKYGGRVLIDKFNNEINEKLLSLDFNSFYPFAMSKYFIQTGFPKQINKNWTVDYILNHKFKDRQIYKTSDNFISEAFLKINIKAINITHKFPLLKNLSTGINYVDLITLEDLIKFHQIEAEILDGVYYDDKRDYSICDFMNKLYDLKQKTNSSEYKFIMNSFHGNTLRRIKNVKNVNISEDKLVSYIANNYEYFIEAKRTKDGDKYNVKLYKDYTNHYNLAFFGIPIYSLARRYLFSMIYELEKNNINVLYSATDSIFIKYSDFEKFNELFPDIINNKLGGMKIENIAKSGVFYKKRCYKLILEDGSIKTRGI